MHRDDTTKFLLYIDFHKTSLFKKVNENMDYL